MGGEGGVRCVIILILHYNWAKLIMRYVNMSMPYLNEHFFLISSTVLMFEKLNYSLIG